MLRKHLFPNSAIFELSCLICLKINSFLVFISDFIWHLFLILPGIHFLLYLAFITDFIWHLLLTLPGIYYWLYLVFIADFTWHSLLTLPGSVLLCFCIMIAKSLFAIESTGIRLVYCEGIVRHLPIASIISRITSSIYCDKNMTTKKVLILYKTFFQFQQSVVLCESMSIL